MTGQKPIEQIASIPRFERSGRIIELDGLRGFATVLIVATHFVANGPHTVRFPILTVAFSLLGIGSVGLDLFFVLSGFLIGGILLRERNSPRYFSTFYLRRFHRIFPIYYAWLILFLIVRLVAVHVYAEPPSTFHTGCPIPLYFVYLQNWFFSERGFALSWLGPTWSLGVEEQFYLTIPLLVRFLPLRRLTQLLVALVLFAPLFRVAVYVAYGWPSFVGPAFAWTPSRADQLALGVLAAIVSSSPTGREWIRRHLQLIYGMLTIFTLLICVQILPILELTSVEGNVVAPCTIEFFALCLILVLVYHPQGKLAAFCRLSWFRQLGIYSYCIYLIHYGIDHACFYFILHGRTRFNDWPSIFVSFMAFGITIGVAALSWRYFEKPLLKRGEIYRY